MTRKPYVHMFFAQAASLDYAVSVCNSKGRQVILKKRTTDNWDKVTCVKCLERKPQNEEKAQK